MQYVSILLMMMADVGPHLFCSIISMHSLPHTMPCAYLQPASNMYSAPGFAKLVFS